MKTFITCSLIVLLASSSFARSLQYPPQETAPAASSSSSGGGVNTGAIVAGSLAITALVVYLWHAHKVSKARQSEIRYHLVSAR